MDRFPTRAFSAWRGRSSRSIHNWRRPCLLIAVSVACGWTAWSGHVLALPVAVLFPALWAMSPSRLTAVLVSAGYFLAASRGLPQGVANFYAADLWPGLLLWVAASLSFAGVHAALWKGQPEGQSTGKGRPGMGRAARYLAAAMLMGLPPLGITGWAHPLTATGVLFPGWGWWGLGAMTAGLAMMTSRYWPAVAIVLGGFWLWSAATWTSPDIPEGWKGVDLEQGSSLGRDGSLDHHRDLIATVHAAASAKTRLIVLPESALGFWTPTVARLWQQGLRGSEQTVIAGAAVLDASGYDNVMVAISAGGDRVLYRERMPVPVSMWQPWRTWAGRDGGARAHLFDNPAVEIDGNRIAPLICYEQLILWPVLQSMLHSPIAIVAPGNGWWTAGTSIVAIQNVSVMAWAKLFGLPVVTAFNR
ncbi:MULTISPECIES: conjugal transfer protein TraB [Rhizobium]|uniref:Conjugal transfer protein TraB n=1 Tax=Rhizobium tumorigenes TaxID=2041385 RepID=A0AAF1KTQ4_9HYPH|nr:MULTISPECIES: conjugal transfer protein TraB [Rhizobium]WFR98475.1 conjugal transfer protein TraB [Rhizobium tumorigenes]WFS03988.1 conjugal transfer protein TraB [Rhizobium tumorigenes]